jgi:hypothetical protein
MFTKTSRYASVPDAVYTDAAGRQVPYKLLRRIPSPRTRERYVIAQWDRLDLLAYRFFGDPEQYWRLCDANRGIDPETLLARPGRVLDIPEPEG